MLKILDIFPGWMYCLCIAVLLTMLGVDSVRISHEKEKYSDLQAQIAQEKEKAEAASEQAEEDARTTEERREQSKQEVIQQANHDTEVAKAAADSANLAAAGLRERIAALVASSRKASGNPSVAGRSTGQQDSDPIGMLGRVLSDSDQAAGVVAAYADQLRVAGGACEAQYDALK